MLVYIFAAVAAVAVVGVYKFTSGNDGFVNRLELAYRIQGWFDSIKSR